MLTTHRWTRLGLQIWLVIPDPPLPPGAVAGSGSGSAISASGTLNGASTSTSSKGKAPAAPRFGKAKVEFLATLDQHTLNVNTVRFSPSGGCLTELADFICKMRRVRLMHVCVDPTRRRQPACDCRRRWALSAWSTRSYSLADAAPPQIDASMLPSTLLQPADAGTSGIFIWRLSPHAPTASFGSTRSEDQEFAKEKWTSIKLIK